MEPHGPHGAVALRPYRSGLLELIIQKHHSLRKGTRFYWAFGAVEYINIIYIHTLFHLENFRWTLTFDFQPTHWTPETRRVTKPFILHSVVFCRGAPDDARDPGVAAIRQAFGLLGDLLTQLAWALGRQRPSIGRMASTRCFG